MASFLSDRIVDELLDALSHCHHRLVSLDPEGPPSSPVCASRQVPPLLPTRPYGPSGVWGPLPGVQGKARVTAPKPCPSTVQVSVVGHVQTEI